MVVEIPIKVVNQTSPGLTQIKQDVDKVTKSVDQLEKEFEQAEKEAADAAKTTHDNFVRVTTGITAGVEAGRALIEGFRAAGEAVQMLAENGSPAFVRLQGEIDQTREALVGLADDPALQSLANSLAGMFDANAVKGWGDALTNAFVDGSMKILEIKNQLGLLSDEQLENARQVRGVFEQQRELAKQLVAEERELLRLEQERGEIQKIMEQGRQTELNALRQSVLSQEKDRDKLYNAIQREEALLKQMSEDGKLTDDAKQKAAAKIQAYHNRIVEIGRQEEQERKAAAAAQKKDLEDFLKLSEKLTAEANKRRAEEKQAELDKKAATLQPQLQQLRGGIGDRQVFEQIVKQRTEGMGEKEALATRRELFRNRGQIGGDEIEGARDTLLKDTISQMRQSGQLDTQTAHALQQAQQQMQQEREGAQANQDMLKEVSKQFGETLKATVKGQQETQRLQNLIDDLTRQVEQVGNNANALQQQSPAQRAKVSRNGG